MKVNVDLYNEKVEDNICEVEVTSKDCWSLDYTLSKVIYPALLKFKEDVHGAPWTDDEDVPEGLKSTSAKPKENHYDTDEFYFKRWEWILDEMIWGFEQISEDKEGSLCLPVGTEDFAAYHERIKNATRLFGKYYQALWN